MVDVEMNLMPSKIIGRGNCLRAKGPFGLLKDLGPKRHPNSWRREDSKEIKNFVKVEDGGVHLKIYDGHCTKQRIKIPKVFQVLQVK